MTMKSKLLLLFLMAAAYGDALAMDEERSANIRLLALGDAASSLNLPPGFQEPAVALIPDTRSAVLAYRGPVTFFLQEQSPGQRAYSVDLRDTGSNELLLMLLPGSDEARAIIFEDSPVRFPAGTILAANLFAESARFLLGDEEAEIASGKSRVLQMPAGRSAVMVRVFSTESGELLFSNNWAVRPGSRSLLLLLPPDETGQSRPWLRRLSEIVPES